MSGPAATRGRALARGRFVRSLAIPFLAVLLLLLLPVAASAHAQVVALDPVDGARLPVAPASVSVTFNENVSPAPGGLRVIRPDGSLADVGEDVVVGSKVSQSIGPLADGWYVMAWSIISADGHVVHGTATFAVGDADAAPRPAASSLPSPLEAALWIARGLSDLLLLIAAGAAIAWSALRARTPRVRRLWVGVLSLGVVATAIWLAVEIIDGGASWLDTQYAWSGITRLALLAASLILLLLRPPRTRAAAIAAIVAVVTLAWGGHATGSPLTSVTLAMHLLAAITWLGAAPAVALVMWDRAVSDDDAFVTVRGFSRLATVALFVLIVGGSASGLLLTNGLEGGLTIYVWILLAKVGIVGIAAILGALGRRGLGRGADRGRYRRLFLLDATLLVVVALLSSALTLVGPHQGHAGHEGHIVTSPRCSMTLGQPGSTFGAAFIADPGTPGTNALLVSGVPAGVQGVAVELLHQFTGGSPISVPLSQGPRGWVGSAVLPFTGDWIVTALVRVDTFTEARGTCDITIAP
jgi:copper transport protein